MSVPFVPTQLNHLVADVLIASAARGDVLYRGASKWNNLAAGASGHFLKSNGAGADPSWAAGASGDALTTGTLAQFAATTSAQLAGVISDETGTGSLVFGTTPTVATPVLTGTTVIRQTGGVAGTDEAWITHDGNDLLIANKDGGGGSDITFTLAGNEFVQVARSNGLIVGPTGVTPKHLLSSNYRMASDVGLGWSSNSSVTSANNDAGLARVGAAVVKMTDGSTGGGILEFPQVAAGGTPSTNSGRVYAKDVAGNAEIFVKDEAGTETQISPHNQRGPASLYDAADPLPHVVEEHNAYLGGVRYLNVSRACMLLEDLLKAIAAGNTLTQIRTFLNNRGPGFIDIYRTETYAAHNARLGLTGEQALTVRSWSADQNAKQAQYDAERAAELAAHVVWEEADPETRPAEPPVRPAADVRKPVPQWLQSRGAA